MTQEPALTRQRTLIPHMGQFLFATELSPVSQISCSYWLMGHFPAIKNCRLWIILDSFFSEKLREYSHLWAWSKARHEARDIILDQKICLRSTNQSQFFLREHDFLPLFPSPPFPLLLTSSLPSFFFDKIKQCCIPHRSKLMILLLHQPSGHWVDRIDHHTQLGMTLFF